MTDHIRIMNDFKDEIRSYLIPFKNGVPIFDLKRDYYNFMGKNLPFLELGFADEMELLQAVPDAVRITRRGNEIFVLAVCNEETAHLAKLVSKQKSTTCNSKATNSHHRPIHNKFHRPNIPPRMQSSSYRFQSNVAKRMIHHHLNLPRCVPQTLKDDIQDLLQDYPNGLEVDNLKAAFKHKYGIELHNQNYDYATMTDFVKSLDSENILKLHENPNCILIYHPKIFNRQILQKSVKSTPSSINCGIADRKVQSRKGENESSRSARLNENINEKVYNNFRKVMNSFPQGFPLTLLNDRYKEIIGYSLDCKELGYNDVQELICHLDDIFCVKVQGDGVWMLTDANLPQEPEAPQDKIANVGSKEIPVDLQQNIYDLLRNFSEGILLSELESMYKMNFNNSIPWKALQYASLHSMLTALRFRRPIRFVNSGLTDFRIMLMGNEQVKGQISQGSLKTELCVPEDAIILGQIYNPPKIPEEDQYFPVFVATVYTPGQVWLQCVSQEEIRNIALDQLMDDLEDFYHSYEADKYRIPDKLLKKTMNCAVLYPDDQNWHRGCIVDQLGPTTYKVFYYDYGTFSVVEKGLIRLLKRSFAALPAQAFCTRLANIMPFESAYSTRASQRLFDLVSCNKPLMAMITSKFYMNTNSVILCDTSEEDDIFLNDLLVKEGLVQVCKDKIEVHTPYSPSYHPNNDVTIASTPDYQQVSTTLPKPPGLESIDNVPTQSFPFSFMAPLSTRSSEFGPPGFSKNTGPNIIHNLFGENRDLNCSVSHTIYQPPNFSHCSEKDENINLTPNSEVLKRIGDNILAKKKLLNLSPKNEPSVPKAAVEPIQYSMKDSEVLVPLSPVNKLITNSDRPEIQYQLIEHSEIQEDELYESSKEDEDQNSKEDEDNLTNNFDANACSSNQLRFCKRVFFRESVYKAHLINFYGQPCFTSADISSFVFGIDILKRILNIQKYPACHILASREHHSALFADLEYSSVTGFTTNDDKSDKVVLYVLSDVVKILNFLDHNKQTLIQDIEEIYKQFDSNDVFWMTRPDSPDSDEVFDKEVLEAKLEEVKDERKQLLQAMLDDEILNAEDSDRLLLLNRQLSRIKNKLSRLSDQEDSKSAADQAREFLKRMKLTQECVSKQEETAVSPPLLEAETVSSAPILETETASSPPRLETETVVSTTSYVLTSQTSDQANPVGSVATHARNTYYTQYAAQRAPAFGVPLRMPVVPTHSLPPVLPVNYTQIHPNTFVYPHLNVAYPTTNFNLNLPRNFNQFFNWQ